MTAFNTPTVAEHPPIIYPTTPYIVVPVAAAGRTTKNTDAQPLGIHAGISRRINAP